MDIEQYRRIPAGIVHELEINSSGEAERELEDVINSDCDGITMVLIDYKRYHAVAVIDIDFEERTYKYIDSVMNTLENIITGNLDHMLPGLAEGEYAVNYLEIEDNINFDFSNF